MKHLKPAIQYIESLIKKQAGNGFSAAVVKSFQLDKLLGVETEKSPTKAMQRWTQLKHAFEMRGFSCTLELLNYEGGGFGHQLAIRWI